MENNLAALEAIRRATIRNHTEAGYTYFKRKMKFKARMIELNMLVSKIDDMIDGAYQSVEDSRMNLHRYRDELMIPPLPQEEEHYNRITKKLENVGRFHDLLIRDTFVLDDLSKTVDGVADQLEDLYKDLEEHYL